MGLKNIFNRKKEDFTNYDCNDFAREFKLAYEKDDIKMMNTLINNWYDIGENDANYRLANIIYDCLNKAPMFGILAMGEEIPNYKPKKQEYYDWYYNTAYKEEKAYLGNLLGAKE